MYLTLFIGKSGTAGAPELATHKRRFGTKVNSKLNPADGSVNMESGSAASITNFTSKQKKSYVHVDEPVQGGSEKSYFDTGICGFKNPQVHSLDSIEILKKAKQRQEQDTSEEDPNQVLKGKKERIIVDLHSFLEQRGGEASTDEIVKHFEVDIGKEDRFLFRQMLKNIAYFSKRQSKWKLKKDFKPN